MLSGTGTPSVRRNWFRHKRDGGVGKLGMKAVEDGDNMRGLAGIISEQGTSLVSEGTDDGDLFDSRFQGKQTIVLQQNHGLIREFARQSAMLGAVKFLLIDLCVRDHVRRVEHAKFYASRKQAINAVFSVLSGRYPVAPHRCRPFRRDRRTSK